MSGPALFTTLLTIAALAAIPAPATADCPSDDWITGYNGFCYILVNNTWPWYVSKDACDQVAATGATLTSIHDAQLNAFVAETVAGEEEAWLGMTRATTYADWTWTDGTPFNFSYWYQDEPYGTGELCGVTNCGRVGEWCAKSCDDYNSVFVCEFKDGGFEPTTEPPTTLPPTTAAP